MAGAAYGRLAIEVGALQEAMRQGALGRRLTHAAPS